jgi:hypothetical protein
MMHKVQNAQVRALVMLNLVRHLLANIKAHQETLKQVQGDEQFEMINREQIVQVSDAEMRSIHEYQ